MNCTVSNKYSRQHGSKHYRQSESTKYGRHSDSPHWRDYEHAPAQREKYHVVKKVENTRVEVVPSSGFNSSVEDQFYELARRWKNQTAGYSIAALKIKNPYYFGIIGMGVTIGEPIVRLILEDLQRGPDYWHYALKNITKENPVSKDDIYNLEKIREAWLNWGVQHKLI